jgi:uncharacterized protein YaiE (UPF0345 family)
MRHNRYFGDRVQSLGFSDAAGDATAHRSVKAVESATGEGSPRVDISEARGATVGVIEPGEYAFGTSREERMTVVSGVLWYRVPGREWMSAAAGEGFAVRAGVTFEVKAEAPVSYLCRHL